MPQIVCSTCRQSVHKPPSYLRNRNFCSDRCRLVWLNEYQRAKRCRITLSCTLCKRPFERVPSHVWPTGNNFCSGHCQAAWHSQQLREGYNPQRGNPHTTATKDKIRAANTGRRFSPEVNKSKGLPGCSNPFFGKRHSLATRQHLAELAKQRMADPAYRQKNVLAVFKANRRRPNQLELKLKEILNCHWPEEWEYTGDGALVIGGYVPDFTNCNGQKAVIELFGHYWHEERNQKWSYSELGRVMAYNALGFRCLVIWENELKNQARIVTKIQKFMRLKT